MMGDIDEMNGNLSDDCGITPRIFEYLFSRITKVDGDNFLILFAELGFLPVCSKH